MYICYPVLENKTVQKKKTYPDPETYSICIRTPPPPPPACAVGRALFLILAMIDSRGSEFHSPGAPLIAIHSINSRALSGSRAQLIYMYCFPLPRLCLASSWVD
jgi:hypothetical protein